MLIPLSPLDVLIHFFLPSPSGRQKFPLWENPVWILSGTTHCTYIFNRINGLRSYIMLLMSMNGFWKKEKIEDAIITSWMIMRG
jgi:hypothetical protein